MLFHKRKLWLLSGNYCRQRTVSFIGMRHLNRLFKRSKRVIVDIIEKGVKTFEINRTTGLATDYSKTEISYFLFQKHCTCPGKDDMSCGDDQWKLILAGSQFTNDAESRYAPVEGEALALVYGLESSQMFILGCPDLLVTVDHQPLMRIFSDKALENIKKPCLFNFKEQALMYKFRIKHRPGRLNAVPDCASWYPAGTPSEDSRKHAQVPLTQAQQEGMQMNLKTGTVYPTKMINSGVKAAFTSMYENDPKLKE